MARKSKGPEMEAKVEAVDRPVRLSLPPAYHRILRLVAADSDISMSEFVKALVMKALDQEAKDRGIKR